MHKTSQPALENVNQRHAIMTEMPDTSRIYIATTNPGKLREFREAALAADLPIAALPGMAGMQTPVEDGDSFEANSRIKAEYYSRSTPGEWYWRKTQGWKWRDLAARREFTPPDMLPRFLRASEGPPGHNPQELRRRGQQCRVNPGDGAAFAFQRRSPRKVCMRDRNCARRKNSADLPGAKLPANCLRNPVAVMDLAMIPCFTSLLWARPLPNCRWKRKRQHSHGVMRFGHFWSGSASIGLNWGRRGAV